MNEKPRILIIDDMEESRMILKLAISILDVQKGKARIIKASNEYNIVPETEIYDFDNFGENGIAKYLSEVEKKI